MNDTTESPLRYTPRRHALLHQIHTLTGTDRGWTRTRNPAKIKKPQSGLPDYLYGTRDLYHRPSADLQRAARELDHHGLLGLEPGTDGTDDLGTSPLGTRLLDAWTDEFGQPGTLR